MKVFLPTLALLLPFALAKANARKDDDLGLLEERRKNKVAVRPYLRQGRKLQSNQPCLEEFELWTSDGCSTRAFFEILTAELESVGCAHTAARELVLLTGLSSIDEAREAVQEACEVAIAEMQAEDFVDFDIGGGNPVFTKAFFDGGTYYNDLRETELGGTTANVLEDDPGAAIELAMDTIVSTTGLTWPGEIISNFESCELRAAMCCWVQDRQAADGNGNCRRPYDRNCVDADPADNTDICLVDMSRSPDSSRVESGFALFPDDAEGDAHCHGFAWSNDPTHPSSVFKGNNLFYVSLYDHLAQRGYVKEVPGAPMCGCVEKMPVVSRSDCTQIDVNEFWASLSFSSGGGLQAEVDPAVDIEFNTCRGSGDRNDLYSYYEGGVERGHTTADELDQLGDILVGEDNCPNAINSFMAQMGWAQV